MKEKLTPAQKAAARELGLGPMQALSQMRRIVSEAVVQVREKSRS